MSDNHATPRLHLKRIEAARDEAESFDRPAGAPGLIAELASTMPPEALRSTTTERVQQALQGRLPIEALDRAEQDAVFDGMLDAYINPPASVRESLAEVVERTRNALNGAAKRQDVT